MKLRLLGPLELVVGRRSVNIGGPRQRVVLAMLALNVNRVTPIDSLVDALWDEEPPSTARAQIQTCIYGLRKLFAHDAGLPEAIQTKPPGYLLELPTADLDSQEFTALVAEGRAQARKRLHEDAARTLRAALALWRGPMLADISSDLVQRGAASFEDGRVAAIEERVRLDLALGRHETVISELAALVEEHPYNEPLAELRMIALYRCGRQADALDAARRTRAVLSEELGIEPGNKLSKLETAILNRDPTLDYTPPVPAAAKAPAQLPQESAQRGHADRVPAPRQLPASIADFTGREEQIEAIKATIAPEGDQGAYAVRIVGISGKGGVGKSSLAVRVAHELREQFPDGQLYGDLQNHSGMDDPSAALLARFLRSLGVNGAAVPEDPQERAEMYRSLLADKRVLVVLDDVTSEVDVVPLLPGSATCAVIATSRMRLPGLFGARWFDIDVLDTEASTGLLAKIIGPRRVAAETGSVEELVALCGGLPLALRIAGARLESRPHWRVAALVARLQDEVGRLDEFTYRGYGLRFNIDLTYRSLPERAKRLLRLFAVVRAADFPAWMAAALLGTDLIDAEDVLEQLVEAQLLDVVDIPGERLRYRFHSLIRIYAGELLTATESAEERSAALERVIGGWLALAEDAHRDEYGGDYTILHGTAPRWRPPGRVRRDRSTNPMAWWDSERAGLVEAVRQAAATGLDELCWDLALTSITLFEVKGYYDYWRETATLGLDVTRRAENRRGYAVMLYSLGTLNLAQKRLADADKCFAEALEIFSEVGDGHGRALVLRNSAIIDSLHGDSATMLEKYTESLALLRECGDRMGEAQVLRSVAEFRGNEGDGALAAELLDSALSICREVGCLRGEAQVLYRFANLRLESGALVDAQRDLSRVRDIVHQIGDRMGEAYAQYGLGIALYREGRAEEAETALHAALDLALLLGERLVEGQSLYVLGEISLGRGDHETGALHLAAAGVVFADLGSALWHAKTLILQSGMYAGMGAPAEAGERADRARTLLGGLDSQEATRLLSQLDAG
ncbi:MAG: BTAD domain-containing putative transcriptional regulator [Actinophytocola sp.]|uniref:AfsR/SARP family transcriptional regulator n=1 Tax=Actinophytocola sp. TaxID=1872138 RepID=UPI003C752BE9